MVFNQGKWESTFEECIKISAVTPPGVYSHHPMTINSGVVGEHTAGKLCGVASWTQLRIVSPEGSIKWKMSSERTSDDYDAQAVNWLCASVSCVHTHLTGDTLFSFQCPCCSSSRPLHLHNNLVKKWGCLAVQHLPKVSWLERGKAKGGISKSLSSHPNHSSYVWEQRECWLQLPMTLVPPPGCVCMKCSYFRWP